MSVPEDQDPLLNTVLGGARIQRRVSAGLLANVYLGHYERLNVAVAVKVLTPKATAQGMNKERFVREGRALAQLSHQNIIKIYNVGHDNGRYFIVMDWIQDGMNLRQLAQSRPLTPVQSLKVARRLAEALEYIHSKNLIHRDIKPANVCLRKGGVPVLMDFSLIKDQSSDVQLTAPGTIMGTVNFMPPEQAQPGGPFGNVGPWSDVYSLGGTLYWLLTGRPPFKGRTPMETIIKLIREPHIAPSQINPSVPPELDDLIARCLAKKSDERYQNAREFMVAVDQLLQTCADTLARGTPPPLATEDDGPATPAAPGSASGGPAPSTAGAPPQGSAVSRNWGAGGARPPSSGIQPAIPLGGRGGPGSPEAVEIPPAMRAPLGAPAAVAAQAPPAAGSGIMRPGQPGAAPRGTTRLGAPAPAPANAQWAPTTGLDVPPDMEATVRLRNQQGAPAAPPPAAAPRPAAPAGKKEDLKRSWVEDLPSKPSWTDEQKDPNASVLGMRQSSTPADESAPADGAAPPAPADPAPPADAAPPKPAAKKAPSVSDRMHKAAVVPKKARRSTLETVIIVIAVIVILACIGVGTYVLVNKVGP